VTIIDNERPDLTVMSVSGPAQAATGIPTTVTAVVRNLAAGAAPASKLGVFLSSSSSTPGAGVRVALVDVPALAALATATVKAAVTIPGNVSTGSYSSRPWPTRRA
jgi:CARDB